MSSPRSPRSRWSLLAFSRSLASFVKSKFSCTFSFAFGSQQPSDPLDYAFAPRTKPGTISHPLPLQRHTARRHNVSRFHFIHQLPVEIISLIFIIGAEQDSFFPVTVSHVCRAWRQIALRTPALWRRITLGPEEEMWRERIYRARACTLDIQLLPYRTAPSGARRVQDLNPYNVFWYMQLAIPHIRQWRSLELCFADYSPHLWKAALHDCSTPAPSLKELILTYRRNDDIDEFLLFSGHAPRLRRLTVEGIRLVWMPSLFGNLTFLDYTHHGFTSERHAVHDVLSILAVTTRLHELRVLFPRKRTIRLPSRRDITPKRVSLPHLRNLVLRVDGSDIPFELAHLVSLISSPFLSSLRLIDLRRSPHSFPSLKSFFYVCALPSNLRFVHIGHAWYDPRMVHAMIHSLPQLSKIVVKRSRVPEQVYNVRQDARRDYSSHSFRQTQGQNFHRHYQIDHLSVQYFPRGSKA
ncbi:hypothetical protein CVT26_016032 [Gymnopilus dilepis]|uniref:F-box domain-containing protein n=1 Tax=Gymnopilus dilepis TaxID=231916 RepID=A0A409YDQ7_9AGAR|nr:hypothetical protein CVT26_016032 [Gymnopilus dilepis]